MGRGWGGCPTVQATFVDAYVGADGTAESYLAYQVSNEYAWADELMIACRQEQAQVRYKIISNLGQEYDWHVPRLLPNEAVPEIMLGHLKRSSSPIATRNVHFVAVVPL